MKEVRMSGKQVIAVKYIRRLPESKLGSAIDYLRYLYEQESPLDDFDYVLARRADEDTSTETISFDALLQDLGINHEELVVISVIGEMCIND